MSDPVVATSKSLSLLLRRHPEPIGIDLDAEGWAAVEVLLTARCAYGQAISRQQLEKVVRTNGKLRFVDVSAFNGTRQKDRSGC